MSLLIRAGRIAPELLVQTFSPDHEVLCAAVEDNPNIVVTGERLRRSMLSLPRSERSLESLAQARHRSSRAVPMVTFGGEMGTDSELSSRSIQGPVEELLNHIGYSANAI